ncbi:MAG: DUF4286 family protein [Gammaproteobacteria bacterium]|nr:DUF4286 family protein [Gammaproteobacteria bacterium]MDH5344170.1 DUF4286 family protein [Gammaproteobacteria bacterium]
MPRTFALVYEVTHVVDPDIIGDFDDWLASHVEEMLELPGIVRASIFVAGEDEAGRPRRVTHYLFDSDRELDAYLDGPAAVMRAGAERRFGGHFEVSRRILKEAEVVDGGMKTDEACLNCGTVLTGQYCGECGQRSRSRLISIWELLQEAFGDLFELDSRLWRTLIPLALRPGQLTRDYLEGRRARYMPPFRTYLVLSVLFFLVAFFDPHEEFGILFEPEQDVPEAPAETRDAGDVRRQVLDELAAEGIAVPADPERAADDQDDDMDLVLSFGNDKKISSDRDCQNVDVGDLPAWMASRLTNERVKLVCERLVSEGGGASFFAKLLDYVPTALFVLLPLLAFMLKLLYPLSKRYYVEHLLFVIHYHAFLFLILTLQILFDRFAVLVSLPGAATAATSTAVSLYIPVYLYKAMRRVYGQGRAMTTLKFFALLVFYVCGLSLLFLFAALFAAFSI